LHSHGEKFILLADKFIKFNWETYAIDLRGHGLSWTTAEQRGDVENYQNWIDDVVEFIAYLHETYPFPPIYLVAESMGAGVAVHVANSHPPGLQGLVLISPALKPIPQVKINHGVPNNVIWSICSYQKGHEKSRKRIINL
jgi:alpha-beta hydrolase superfamily lysophospholipase